MLLHKPRNSFRRYKLFILFCLPAKTRFLQFSLFVAQILNKIFFGTASQILSSSTKNNKAFNPLQLFMLFEVTHPGRSLKLFCCMNSEVFTATLSLLT